MMALAAGQFGRLVNVMTVVASLGLTGPQVRRCVGIRICFAGLFCELRLAPVTCEASGVGSRAVGRCLAVTRRAFEPGGLVLVDKERAFLCRAHPP